jgi:peroxiredoxin/GNAT superfamily N-acetyltransferase
MSRDPTQLPPGLPVPWDDGACDHLGKGPFDALPDLALSCTDGSDVRLTALGRSEPVVMFFYPRTGLPGQPPNVGFSGEDWDTIPGARGCTPQSCAFRDHFADFRARGTQVFGVSTNTTAHQREFQSRQHIPFHLLSDDGLLLARALRLPTFEFPVESGGPSTLYRRFALFIERGRIVKVWYPVFPPDENAARVLHWFDARAADRARSAGSISVRRIVPADRPWVQEELVRNWGATQITSLGAWYDADLLPGFIAVRDGAREGERVGLLTHTPPVRAGDCEVITLSSRVEDAGIGSQLLSAAVEAARAAGCRRIHLTTTNDNLRAIGFYQKRSWRVAAVHRGAMDRARELKPAIPGTGLNGIPLRDEIELEMILDPRP